MNENQKAALSSEQSLRQQILDRMKSLDLSIPQVAESAGMGRVSLYRWLHGQSHMATHRVMAVCEAVGIRYYFLSEEND